MNAGAIFQLIKLLVGLGVTLFRENREATEEELKAAGINRDLALANLDIAIANKEERERIAANEEEPVVAPEEEEPIALPNNED